MEPLFISPPNDEALVLFEWLTATRGPLSNDVLESF